MYHAYIDYDDDRPSISLMGIVPNAEGDTCTPAKGRGVLACDLWDVGARRRFGEFGRGIVESERIRRTLSIDVVKNGDVLVGKTTLINVRPRRKTVRKSGKEHGKFARYDFSADMR